MKLVRLALNAREILADIDAGSSTRARSCTPNLIKFHEEAGKLDFVTRCATSRNSWYQRVAIEDWDLLKSLLTGDKEEEPEVEETVPKEEPEEEQPLETEEATEEAKEDSEVEAEEDTTEAKEASLRRVSMTWDEAKEVSSDILNADIRVACNCPAFLYHGYAYITDQLDAGENTLRRYPGAEVPEGRAPDVRNPSLEGVICKHLIAVLNRYF
jgi:hypothetical protein